MTTYLEIRQGQRHYTVSDHLGTGNKIYAEILKYSRPLTKGYEGCYREGDFFADSVGEAMDRLKSEYGFKTNSILFITED